MVPFALILYLICIVVIFFNFAFSLFLLPFFVTVFVIYIGQKIYMLLLLPRCPNKVTIGGKRLLISILPPVALLQDRLDDRKVIAWSDIELLRHVDLALFLAIGRCT